VESYIYYVIMLIFLTDDEFRRLVERDPEIIEKLYEEFKKAVTTYFVVKTFGNKAVADDLTQETFCSIMESAHRLKNKERLSFWVLTIAKRTLVKYQRKLFRSRKYMEIIKERYEAPPDFIELLEKKQKLVLFKMALHALPPVYRQIFDLRFEENLSVKEVAAKTGKTVKSVENLLRRIKKKLKNRMLAMGKSFFQENEGDNHEK
jgi:RNA polymerase sigma-70 factor, ECF subfamily